MNLSSASPSAEAYLSQDHPKAALGGTITTNFSIRFLHCHICMEQPTSANAPPAGPDEVRWQVAFFALVPLAVGTMTQPVGRVLDTAPELRFWLRSSPIFCAADMIYFLTRVAIDYILEPVCSWRHFKAELAYRFRDEDWISEPKDVEKAALGRWVLIFLGGIPCQTIKLVAMRGIPLTQTWALLFLFGLIYGEVLIITAKLSFRRGSARTDVAPPSSQASWWLDSVQTFCHSLHVALCAEVLLFTIPKTDPRDFRKTIIPVTFPVFAASVPGSLKIFGQIPGANGLLWVYLGYIYMTCVSGPLNVWIFLILFSKLEKLSLRAQIPLWGASFIVFCPLFVVVMLAALEGFRKVGNKMEIWLPWLNERRVGRALGFPRTSAEQSHIVIFLINTTTVAFAYAYIYDSKSTVNPSLTGIFG